MSAPSLWPAALDLRLGENDSLILVTRAPHRWDELLDARLPLLISSKVGSWDEVAAGLWEAGCPSTLPLRLVEAHGQVRVASWQGQSLEPRPGAEDWTLAIGWTHPEEGWRARLPLWRRRFVVTRAAEQGEPLVRRLRELGADAVSVPTIAFSDPDDFAPWIRAVGSIASFDWILLTSPNGVDYFLRRLCDSGLDLRALAGARLACIGPSTAKALHRHGLKADLVPQEFVAEGLLEGLRTEIGELRGKRFLLPRAQVARSVLPDALLAAGAEVLVAPVYKTVAPDLSVLPSGPAELLFTSSSTVVNWIEAAAGTSAPTACYCIGPITAQTAREHGLEVRGVASTYTVDGLLELLIESAASASSRAALGG